MADAPRVVGPLAAHPLAAEFASVVHAIHLRYAAEVVGAFELCPFMNDPASAFGRFVVALESQPSLDVARDAVLEAPGVVHVVYPLCLTPSREFERFGNALHEAVRRVARARGDDEPPVHATFHPEMEGDPASPQRVVGFVRRAPDPFVQFVPPGLTSGGGTQFADPATLDVAALLASPPKKPGRVARLSRNELASLGGRLDDLRRERHARYARYLDALA